MPERPDPRKIRSSGPLSAVITPTLWRAFELAMTADARGRLIRLAVAAAEFKAAEKRWPARPAELVPKHISYIPLDPFTGRQMKMVGGEDGVVFYSVGPDGKDGGGQRDDTSDTTGDIVFRRGAAPSPTTAPK